MPCRAHCTAIVLLYDCCAENQAALRLLLFAERERVRACVRVKRLT